MNGLRRCLPSLIGALLALPPAAPAAPRYGVTIVAPPMSEPLGINDAGTVIGAYYPYLYDSKAFASAASGFAIFCLSSAAWST